MLTDRESNIGEVACCAGAIHLVDHARRDSIPRYNKRYRVDGLCGYCEDYDRREAQDEEESIFENHFEDVEVGC